MNAASLRQYERQRIARVLHGDLAPLAAAIRLRLRTTQLSLAGSTEPPDHRLAELLQVDGLLAELDHRLRLLIRDLRCCPEDQDALLDRLKRLLHRLEPETGQIVPLQVRGTPIDLPRWADEPILEIVRESVSNAQRHAAARTIQVQLDYTCPLLAVSIRDDGRGFDPAGVHAGGSNTEQFGLLILAECAREAAGSLQIDSRPGAGTRVELHIPPVRRGRRPAGLLQREVASSRGPVEDRPLAPVRLPTAG